MIPRIVERRIQKSRKPGGLLQYTITLPKEYAEGLIARGVDSLLIVFDHGLGAFPAKDEATEEALITFLQTHPEFTHLFTSPEASPRGGEAGSDGKASVKSTPERAAGKAISPNIWSRG